MPFFRLENCQSPQSKQGHSDLRRACRLLVSSPLHPRNKVAASACSPLYRIQKEIGNKWGIANALYALGIIAIDQESDWKARQLLAESLQIRSALGAKRGIAKSLHQFGRLALGEIQRKPSFFPTIRVSPILLDA
ncbi:hypothetical protein HYR99_15115 [Candidatus Poribacteria bacterium]|nr:hypothetical protein [Candidatus Poribacteria bacterium]